MKTNETPARKRATKTKSVPKPEFTAAVRYRDGSSELIRIRHACDVQDARAVLIEQVFDVHSVVIAQCRPKPES